MLTRLFLLACTITLLAACQSATPTAVPPTATSLPPTETPLPPSATPPPPTATQIPPSATPLPPTATPAPSTATPTATATATPTATATEPPPIEFALHVAGGGSILPDTGIEAFDTTYKDPGAVLYHDGQFHMFYNCQHGYPPREVAIGYATSPDGITWTQVSQDTILRAADVPYDVHVILAGSVIVQDDGDWVLYFYTRDESGSRTSSRIGRATAPAPEGPWTPDPAPVLEPGEQGAWDEFALQRPSVARTEQGYSMVYLGLNAPGGDAMIGMATSPDGVNWTKYDDPAVTSTRFAASDPIFWPKDTGWSESNQLKYPRLKVTPDGWLLFYRTASGALGGRSQIGVAASSDGITWTRIQDEPIFEVAHHASWSVVWVPNVVFANDKYYMFIELIRNSKSYINVTTYEGRLLDATQANAPIKVIDQSGFPMVLVPAGPFVMGSAEGASDAPPHTVTLDDYYVDQFEVTNAHYAAFLNEMGNQSEGGKPWVQALYSEYGHLYQVDDVWLPDEGYADHPVVEVTWYGAKAFCAWRGARLPTEAEWEKAARGTDERTFPWGEDINCDYANFNECRIRESVAAESYSDGVSPYGAYNMAGNVAEWTADWYGADYYTNGPLENPQGPKSSPGDHVASRGGSWYSRSTFLRTFHRNHEFTATSTLRNVGIRCAMSP